MDQHGKQLKQLISSRTSLILSDNRFIRVLDVFHNLNVRIKTSNRGYCIVYFINIEISDKQLYLNNIDIQTVQNEWLTDNNMFLANGILKRVYIQK